jgi:hypothetical protein
VAISTYAELGTAMANWLHRGGLTDRIAEFISLGEARIGREVKARQMEAKSTLTVTDATVDLPSDFESNRALRVAGSNIGWCQYMAPDAFFSEFASSSTSSRRVYTIFGSEIIFPSTPAGDIDFYYYKRLGALSAGTNTLFTSNPDLYLYAAMAVAQPFMKNIPQMPIWEALYSDVRDQVNKSHKEGRYPSGMAVVAIS